MLDPPHDCTRLRLALSILQVVGRTHATGGGGREGLGLGHLI
jgi:hypothetical protein